MEDFNQLPRASDQSYEAENDLDSRRCYSCDICGRSFKRNTYLTAHVRIHTGEKPFRCDVCGKAYTAKSSVAQHKLSHTKQHDYGCDVCGNVFFAKRYLILHKRLHTGERPFKCDLCDKSFVTSSKAGQHRRIHTGEKSHKCDECDKQFSTSSHLTKHRRSHTGERPFECLLCDRKFSESGGLKSHMRIHTGDKPYKCDICGKEFSLSNSMKMHRRLHTGEKPYPCKVCEKEFHTSSSLARHSRSLCGAKGTLLELKKEQVVRIQPSRSLQCAFVKVSELSLAQRIVEKHDNQHETEIDGKMYKIRIRMEDGAVDVKLFDLSKDVYDETFSDFLRAYGEVLAIRELMWDERFTFGGIPSGTRENKKLLVQKLDSDQSYANIVKQTKPKQLRTLTTKPKLTRPMANISQSGPTDTAMPQRQTVTTASTNVSRPAAQPQQESLPALQELKEKFKLPAGPPRTDELNRKVTTSERDREGEETDRSTTSSSSRTSRRRPPGKKQRHDGANDSPSLTLLQKVVFLNTFATTKIWYIASILPPTNMHTAKITSTMEIFLWRGIPARVPMTQPAHDRNEGGLKLHLLAWKCKALLVNRHIRDIDNMPFYQSFLEGVPPPRLPANCPCLKQIRQHVTQLPSQILQNMSADNIYRHFISSIEKPNVERENPATDWRRFPFDDRENNIFMNATHTTTMEDSNQLPGTSDRPNEAIQNDPASKISHDCSICGKSFRFKSHLTEHFRVHTGEKPFKCDYCGLSCRNKGTLKVHVRKHTGERPHVCGECGKVFIRKNQLTYHKKWHDETIQATENDLSSMKLHGCAICGKSFRYESYLTAHVRTHTGEKPFECDHCGMKFIDNSRLKVHVRQHTGERPYICEECGKGFSFRSRLMAHKKWHIDKKPFKCDVCGQGLSHQSALANHKRIHTNRKEYECDLCGKRFNIKSGLIKHSLIHAGKRSEFTCDLCEKSFTTRYAAKQHRQIHTGKKSHKCDECDKQFITSSSLTQHKRTHTRERPYGCQFCGKMFTKSSNLTRHIRIHAGERPDKCDICGEEFIDTCARKMHRLIHTGEEPYQCNV
ncbi:zinc finger protein 271-like [Wyeomyia smithii]|uniref:zinc finger protein 271-like n=1 Tax=Wyeomyia smithii TaxID=174621 RepID=UPI002467B119|nr:zinc finger protein 271-like [Wyeomyia smithii]